MHYEMIMPEPLTAAYGQQGTYVDLLTAACGSKWANTNLFLDSVKSIEYLASAVIVVSSNPCVRPSPRTKICFLLSSICTEELLSTPQITTF